MSAAARDSTSLGECAPKPCGSQAQAGAAVAHVEGVRSAALLPGSAGRRPQPFNGQPPAAFACLLLPALPAPPGARSPAP